MKKIIVLIAMISLFCVTGCTQDNLVCKMVNDANKELKINQDVIIGFKENTMVKVYLRSVIDLRGKYVKYVDELATNLKEPYKDSEGKKGFEMKISKDDKKVVFVLKGNLEQMDEETKNSFSLVSTNQTKEQVKQELETQGYTCK